MRSVFITVLAWSWLPGQDLPHGLSTADWSSIRAAREADYHRVIAVDGGHEARSRDQQWTVHFDARGVEVRPDAGEWTWGLELVSYGFVGSERTADRASDARVEATRMTYVWDDALDEWYVNGSRGLEHGFSVHRRPAGNGTLTFVLQVRGALTPVIQNKGRDVAFQREGTTLLNYTGLKVTDADDHSLPAFFTVVPQGLLLTIDEQGARYPVTIDPVAHHAYMKASNTGVGDIFGISVAVSGNTVVVGAPGEDSNATGVNGNQADNSAWSAGAAYVFVRNGGTWTQQAYLKGANTAWADSFGWSVAISGDTIVVGAYWEDSNATGVDGNGANNSAEDSGAAYVFVRNGTTWSQQAYLKASNTDHYDSFGWSVAVAGDTVVVGAKNEDSNATGVNGNQFNYGALDSGAAYVFARNGTTWGQQAYLKASNTDPSDGFGAAVAAFDDTVVIGAFAESSNETGIDGNQLDNSAFAAGAAYVFIRNGTTWSQQAYLKASNTDGADFFGVSVAAYGNTIVVGAPHEGSSATSSNGNQADNSAPGSGAAYVYVRNVAGWMQQAYLKPSNTGAGDGFGHAVAASHDTVVVGAFREDSTSTGVDGDQTNNSALDSGAAYVFERVGTTWTQKAYLKASNTEAIDSLGWSVSVSGDLGLVGAPYESSSATGVNGNQASNSASSSGAAYVFELRAGCVGSNGRPWLVAANAPRIGQNFTLGVGNLNRNFNQATLVFGFKQVPLPGIDLGPILSMPNCHAYQQADALVPVPTGPSGTAQWNWSVSGSPGDTFFCQALCLDPSATAFGFTVSNQVTITLVP